MKRTILTVAVICLGAAAAIPNFAFARGGSSNNAGGGHGGGHGGGGHQGGGNPGGVRHGGGGGGTVNFGGGGGRPVGNVTHNVNTGVNQANSGIQSRINNQNNQVHLNNGMHHQNMGHRPAMNGSPQIGHHGGLQTTSPSNLSHNINTNPNQFNQKHLNNLNLHQHHTNINNQHNNNHNHNVNNANKNVNLNNNSNHNHSNQNWNKNWNQNWNHANHNHNHNGSNHQFQNNFNHKNFSNQLQFANHHVNLASNNYKPAYHNHSQYYHGHWHGGWGPWANNYGYGGYGWGGYGPYHHHNWGYQPYYWGLGGWGLGSLIYGSGYQSYYNPYYVSSPSICYNYAQPIPVAYNQDTVIADQAIANTGVNSLDAAVAAFKQNNYDAALDFVNKGITETPTDSVLHEFRSLVLFAKGDYQQSAATIHSVLAVGPGWDWTTLSGLYTDVGIYTNQLRALEGAVKQNPGDAAQHFLLGYHYMSDGYNDAAAKQFQQVTAIMPNDNVATNMVKMLTTTQQATQTADPAGPAAQPTPLPPLTDVPSPNGAPPAADQPIAPPVDPTAIVGDWKSSRNDGSKFALSLSADKSFKWTYAPMSQPAQDFDGTYTIDGNVIALERAGGGSLVAEITDNSNSAFNFKMVGAPEDDPGLMFSR